MQVDNPDEIVMVHDGARPFIEQEHLHLLAETAQKQQAALLAVQVTDTIKQKTATGVHSLDRSTLWAAQTPQAFHYQVITKAHELAQEHGFFWEQMMPH